jgi:hypothetical protein
VLASKVLPLAGEVATSRHETRAHHTHFRSMVKIHDAVMLLGGSCHLVKHGAPVPHGRSALVAAGSAVQHGHNMVNQPLPQKPQPHAHLQFAHITMISTVAAPTYQQLLYKQHLHAWLAPCAASLADVLDRLE